jgi:hypothetical protein
MPLSEMHGNLTNGTNIWVAADGEMTPHLEVKFPGDEFDRASLENAIDAHVGEETIPIGPLELQIAYKLSLGGRTSKTPHTSIWCSEKPFQRLGCKNG